MTRRAPLPPHVYCNGTGHAAMFDTPLAADEAYEAYIPKRRDEKGYPESEFLCFDAAPRHFCVWQVRRVRIQWGHVEADGYRAVKREESDGPSGEGFVRVIGGWRDDGAPVLDAPAQFALAI